MVSLLDIIGPVMVGPSSSHTAGACRIGLLVRGLVGGTPEKARIELHGSFARTGEGHGTDKALAGGLLGFRLDVERAGQTTTVIGSSLGAGRIRLSEIDGYPVELTGHLPTIVLVAADQP